MDASKLTNRELLAEVWERRAAGKLHVEHVTKEGPLEQHSFIFLNAHDDIYNQYGILVCELPLDNGTPEERRQVAELKEMVSQNLEGIHEIPLITTVILIPYKVKFDKSNRLQIEFDTERYKARVKEEELEYDWSQADSIPLEPIDEAYTRVAANSLELKDIDYSGLANLTDGEGFLQNGVHVFKLWGWEIQLPYHIAKSPGRPAQVEFEDPRGRLMGMDSELRVFTQNSHGYPQDNRTRTS